MALVTMRKTTAFVAFLSGAVVVAWLGTYSDAFIVPSDSVAVRQVGSAAYSYPILLLGNLLVALMGSTMFGLLLSCVARGRAIRGSVWLLPLPLGALYSFGLMLPVVLRLDPGPVLLGAYAVGMPLLAVAVLRARAKAPGT